MKRVFTLAELAEYTKSRLVGDPAHQITSFADLESATSEDASFLASPLYEKSMQASKAGVVFISPHATLVDGKNFLISEDPSQAFQQTVEAFLGEEASCCSAFKGIHPSAVIHETVKLGENVSIGPCAVIDKNVSIGDSTVIGSGCYIGYGVTIGKNCCFHSNVSIRERCQIGNRVILQPGAVIGSCGFGYTTDNKGNHIKLNQLGIVVIEDDVEIGANTTIDRSRFKSTRIGRGSKIDNLVQIGHGVIIGEHNIIVAQTGIAGSSETGHHVIIAGQVAIAGHLKIASKTTISGRSGVSKSITTAGVYGGVPVMPIQAYNRNAVLLRNIEIYINKIKELEKRLLALERD